MAAPTTTHSVTVRKLSSTISSLWTKIKSTFQTLGNLVTSFSDAPSDTKYPSEKLVKTSLDAKAPNVPSEVTIANGDKILIADSSDSNKVKRASVSFDGSTTGQFISRKGTFGRVLYADEAWGGAFRTSFSPLDTDMMFSRNVFLGVNPDCVKVEYSTDGGTTWIDYGLNDSKKMELFSQFGRKVNVYCGKNTHIQPGYTGSIVGTKDLTNEIIADQRLRITVSSRPLANAGTTSRDGEFLISNLIRRIGIYMSTQSATGGTHCVVSTKTIADFVSGTDTWTERGDYAIQGDPGWNSIPCANDTSENGFRFGSYGNTSTSELAAIRLEIWSTKLNTNPASSQTGNLLIYNVIAISDKVNTGTSKFLSMILYGIPNTSFDLVNGWPVFDNGIKFTERKLKTNLARTADSTFDGSANQENIPVTGTLPVANGGTGKTTALAANNALISPGAKAETDIVDNTNWLFRYDTPSDNIGAVYYRKSSLVWNWIKNKISSVLDLTETSYGGNAATATTATTAAGYTSGGAIATALQGKATPADITTAIQALDVASQGGDGKYIKSISEVDGKISATAETMDNAPTANSTKAVTSDGVKTALDGKQARLGISPSGDPQKFLNEQGDFVNPATGTVSGVKGAEESTYRTGQVSLSPTDLGAWGDYGYFANGSATAARWGKVAKVHWNSAFDGYCTVRGVFEMHQYGGNVVTAQFIITFNTSYAIGYAHMYGIFSDSNLTSQVKLGARFNQSENDLQLYGYIYNHAYSGVSVSIMDVKHYKGNKPDCTITHYSNAASESNEPTGTTYCTNHGW